MGMGETVLAISPRDGHAEVMKLRKLANAKLKIKLIVSHHHFPYYPQGITPTLFGSEIGGVCYLLTSSRILRNHLYTNKERIPPTF